MPTPTATLLAAFVRLQNEGQELLDQLPDEVLEQLPDDVIEDLRNDVIDKIPQEVADRLPGGLGDRIPDSLLAGGTSTTFVAILIVAAAIGVLGFLWGVTKSAMKAALFFALVAVVAAVILFAQ